MTPTDAMILPATLDLVAAPALLDRLRAALQANPAARGLIGGGRSAADVIAALRAGDGELGAAAGGWDRAERVAASSQVFA